MADDKSPELIEQKMLDTRESLSEKVAALENQVMGTIQSATSTVQDTIQTVKEAMNDTVGTVKDTVADVKGTVTDSVQSLSSGVKDTFNLSSHTRNNPLPMVGGATAVGFVAGYLLFRDRGLYARGPEGSSPRMPAAAAPSYAASSSYSAPRNNYSAPESTAAERRSSEPGWFSRLTGPLLDKAAVELKRVGEQALTQAVASLEQSVSTQVPKFIDGVVASATGGLGGSAHGTGTTGTTAGGSTSGRSGTF